MPCPTTAGTACAVLPLGDSITEGWLPTGGVGGYRVELFSKAVLAGKSITFVGSQTSSGAPNTVQNQTFPKKHEDTTATPSTPAAATAESPARSPIRPCPATTRTSCS
jgi:hypothetical protein